MGKSPRPHYLFLLLLTSLCHIMPACQSPQLFGTKNPHEQYAASLKKAGLDQTALGKQWLAAAQQALTFPLTITLPYQEKGFFPPDRPQAFSFQFVLPRGQRIDATCLPQSADTARIFMDLWRTGPDKQPLKLLAVANDSGRLSYEAAEETALVLRLQPELLAAVSYELTLLAGPSLAFPVKGGGNKDIGSVWHDPRDAGARKHEGIDIFAKRGTPAVAAADGMVTSVRTGGLGGKTVFMRPTGKNYSLYYAHLDSQMVIPGQRVTTGDTLGLVGNTGNARTTPPHLHFGIYTGDGAINPLPFVQQQAGKLPPLKGLADYLNQPMRTRDRHTAAATRRKEKGIWPARTFVRVAAVTTAGYRVRLPDETEGFLPPNLLTSLDKPAGRTPKEKNQKILCAPVNGSAVVSDSLTGSLPVFAYFKDYAFVRQDSVQGWVIVATVR